MFDVSLTFTLDFRLGASTCHIVIIMCMSITAVIQAESLIGIDLYVPTVAICAQGILQCTVAVGTIAASRADALHHFARHAMTTKAVNI